MFPLQGISDPVSSFALETSAKIDKDGPENSYIEAVEIGELPTHTQNPQGRIVVIVNFSF